MRIGGHLMNAHVRLTLEVIIIESAGKLRKSYDPFKLPHGATEAALSP